ncbi:MAG: DNRLRE domain-containing protein [Saprospiraceae bacterium]|nr:DNRLRE domain-containing protein [Saprospiraceae bacterium]
MIETRMTKNWIITFIIITPIVLQAQMTLTIVPDSTCGKDAFVWFLQSQQTVNGPTDTTNYGKQAYLTAAESTWSSSDGRRYVLIDFTELQEIPAGSTIEDARLSLFYASNSDLGTHRGSPNNAAIISRIINNWNEATVNWNTRPAFSNQNEVRIAASTSGTQNYTDINITTLIRDYLSDLPNSKGFLIRMETDQPDRSLNFASSDHPNPSLRPRLVIRYSAPENASGDYQEIFDMRVDTVPAPCDEVAFPTETLDAQRFGADYIWSDGSGASTLVVDRTGTYWVDVTLPDCSTLSDTITIIFDAQCCRFQMPNAFTPNNDNKNDTFAPVKPNNCMIMEYEILVYNRWGKKVFESKDPNSVWDGRDGNDDAPSDVYVYWLQYKAVNQNNSEFSQSYKGDVTLIR